MQCSWRNREDPGEERYAQARKKPADGTWKRQRTPKRKRRVRFVQMALLESKEFMRAIVQIQNLTLSLGKRENRMTLEEGSYTKRNQY